jgi:hypothetical protein
MVCSPAMTKMISALLLAAALVGGCGKKADAPAADKDKTADPAAKTADPAKPADPAAPAAVTPPAGTTAAPTGGDVTIASDDDYMTKGKAMIGKMLDTFKADGTDCDKLAADITAITNDATVKALDAYEKAHADAKKKFDAAMKDQTKAFETAATPAITACAKNQKFMDAVSKLGN